MKTASGGRSAVASAPSAAPSIRCRRPSARLIELMNRRRWPSSATTASALASDSPKAIVSRSSRVLQERPASAA